MLRYHLTYSIYKPNKIGTWYDNDFKKQIGTFKKSNIISNVRAIIVPHAGFNYSGNVANEVYSTIDWNNVNKIILLCTSHYTNKTLLPPFDKIEYLNESLDIWKQQINSIEIGSIGDFEKEHSFEMQLPFILTYAKNNVKLLPIIVGGLLPDITYLVDNTTLIIITTDFTHYGKRFSYTPFNNNIKQSIKDKDEKDFEAILENRNGNFETVCGRNAVREWIKINKKLKYEPKLISYEISGEKDDDKNINFSSVSYGGFIYMERQIGGNAIRNIIEEYMRNGKLIPIYKVANYNLLNIPRVCLMIIDVLNIHYNALMSKIILPDEKYNKKGIFITAEECVNLENCNLRGCIGTYYENVNKPLIETIIYYTLVTVFEDTRFSYSSLRNKKNYVDLYKKGRYKFKVNFLEPKFKITNFKQSFIKGKHGIILEHNGRTSTFLPSVMVEHNWTNDRTFKELIEKMESKNFSEQEWQNWKQTHWKDVSIYLYESNEFDEYELERFSKYKQKYLEIQIGGNEVKCIGRDDYIYCKYNNEFYNCGDKKVKINGKYRYFIGNVKTDEFTDFNNYNEVNEAYKCDVKLLVENIVKNNDTLLLKKMLDEGLDINKKYNNNNTLLHFACLYLQKDIIELLYEYNNLQKYTINKSRQYPIDIIIKQLNNENIVNILQIMIPNINVDLVNMNKDYGNTLLHDISDEYYSNNENIEDDIMKNYKYIYVELLNIADYTKLNDGTEDNPNGVSSLYLLSNSKENIRTENSKKIIEYIWNNINENKKQIIIKTLEKEMLREDINKMLPD